MLDANTLKWLEDRKCTCYRCGMRNKCVLDGKDHIYGECYWFEIKAHGTKHGLLREYFRDAAEFESRVAKKLLCIRYEDLPCGGDPDCPDEIMEAHNKKDGSGCNMCIFRAARIYVDDEMMAEGK